MARDGQATRRGILDAAYGLFYRHGFGRVGVDEIAAAAGVTKRTLYYHFASKDDLLAAVLDLQGELGLTRVRRYEERYAGSAEEILGVLFSELARWSAKPGWTGPGFTRLVMELADMPGHPARAIAHRHKAAFEAWWASLLAKAGVAAPAERAREVMLLIEGTTALILIHRDPAYAGAAAEAAKRLVGQPPRKARAPRPTRGRRPSPRL